MSGTGGTLLNQDGNPLMRKNEVSYCILCGWRYRLGHPYTQQKCPDCGTSDSLRVEDIAALEQKTQQVIEWKAPDGVVIEFRDCVAIEIIDEDDLVVTRLYDSPLVYKIFKDITMSWAERTVKQWESYEGRLVYKEPLPGSDRAVTAGCVCRRTRCHDPNCIVATADFQIPPSRITSNSWTDPEGTKYCFDQIQEIAITRWSDQYMSLEIKGGLASSYSILGAGEEPRGPGEIYLPEAERVLAAWDVFKKTTLVVPIQRVGGASLPKTPTPSTDLTNDLLTDLTHRMMEQNVALTDLISLLKPKARTDPATIPLPGFDSIVDREPTITERQAFLAGVVRFVGSVNIDLRSQVEKFFDSIGIPTVVCSFCHKRVPLERIVLHPDQPQKYLGLDCCAETVLDK